MLDKLKGVEDRYVKLEKYLSDPETIKDIMAQHLTSPVKWYETILRMLENEVSIFVEVGPKKVLTGLLKKIIPPDREAKVYNVEDMKSLNLFLEDVKG